MMETVTTFNEFLYAFVMLIISFFLPLLLNMGLKYVEQKVGNEKYAKYISMAEEAIIAAEQIYKGSSQGANKKDYVVNYLSEHTNLTRRQINNIIESMCYHMCNTIKEKKETVTAVSSSGMTALEYAYVTQQKDYQEVVKDLNNLTSGDTSKEYESY